MAYYHIKECDCEYKPKDGYPYYPSFGAIASYQAPLYRKLIMDFSFGYFQNTYLTTNINKAYYHAYKQISFGEITNKTHNYHLSSKLGISLKGSRLEIIPEIGLNFFRRKIYNSDVVIYYFENVSRDLYYNETWPTIAPNYVLQYDSHFNLDSWKIVALSIGFTGNYSITQRLTANLYMHLINAPGWYEVYYDNYRIVQAGVGVSYLLGKKSE